MRITHAHRQLAGCLMIGGFCAILPTTLTGQADSVTVVAGPHYAGSNLRKFLLGHEYRDLWAMPVRVPVLDLDTFAGGLTLVRAGGNVQTLALRFRGADGREFNFRSVDKELTPALPPYAKETFVDWLRQDQTHAQHPAAPVVAAALLDSVGVLNPGPKLVVLPDDPALGQFRERYAGLLGTIEVAANEGQDDTLGFAGAIRVAGTETLLKRLEEDPRNRVVAREFLKARLMDIFIGDWDRHAGQWRWARYDRNGLRHWVPIPEDRDYAFVDYDGVLLGSARKLALPRLITFEEEYPSLLGLTANSMELNRRLLAELSRSTWDSIANDLQARLTDDVIESAVRAMPPAYYEQSGPRLAKILRARRNRLRAVAADFYKWMAENVEIHATDQRDRAEIVRNPNGTVAVRIYAAAEEIGSTPFYERTFFPDETDQIRLFLHGDDDVAQVKGAGGDIEILVIAGAGDDRLEDHAYGPTVFYDSRGNNHLGRGRRTRIDERPYQKPEPADGLLPKSRRDWGEDFFRFQPWAEWRPIAGLVVGGGPTRVRFDFRHDPFASWNSLRALYAPGENRFALEYAGAFRRENSERYVEAFARGSNLEATRFTGWGNDTPKLPGDRAVVWQKQLALNVGWVFPVSSAVELVVGPTLQYVDPEIEAGAPIAAVKPLGSQAMGQAGGRLGLRVDTRDDVVFPRSGFRIEAEGDAIPPVWDVEEAFGGVRGVASTYLPLPVPRGPVLALRAGGDRVFGAYPFYEAAVLGGSRTLRGYSYERFTGDGAVYGSAELRVPLTRANFILRGKVGVSAFGDAGRVFYKGESKGGWHAATGGAVWFATPLAVLSLNYVQGDEDRIYFRFGMPF